MTLSVKTRVERNMRLLDLIPSGHRVSWADGKRLRVPLPNMQVVRCATTVIEVLTSAFSGSKSGFDGDSVKRLWASLMLKSIMRYCHSCCDGGDRGGELSCWSLESVSAYVVVESVMCRRRM